MANVAYTTLLTPASAIAGRMEEYEESRIASVESTSARSLFHPPTSEMMKETHLSPVAGDIPPRPLFRVVIIAGGSSPSGLFLREIPFPVRQIIPDHHRVNAKIHEPERFRD